MKPLGAKQVHSGRVLVLTSLQAEGAGKAGYCPQSWLEVNLTAWKNPATFSLSSSSPLPITGLYHSVEVFANDAGFQGSDAASSFRVESEVRIYPFSRRPVCAVT